MSIHRIWRIWRWRFLLFLIAMTFGKLMLILAQHLYQKEFNPFTNYFAFSQNGLSTTSLLLDTPFCKILDLPSNHSSIRKFMMKLPPLQCDNDNRHWTHVKMHEYLVINETSLGESGLLFDQISCCYNAVHRVEESTDNYTVEADSLFRISDKCIKIKTVNTLMRDEFIKVTCTGTLRTWRKTYRKSLKGTSSVNVHVQVPIEKTIDYEQFHAFALARKSSKTLDKIAFWNKYHDFNFGGPISTAERPPTVLLVGIDSTSRLSFMRNMPKTEKMLEKVGGIQFLGYIKAGEATFENLVPVLSGYYIDDLENICFEKYTRQDSCPYIWWDFEKLGYFTAVIEDTKSFNYLRTAFVTQPTDYYLKTFIVAAERYSKKMRDCTGYEKTIKVLLDYHKNVMKMSTKENVPLFLLSWATYLAHDDVNGAQLGDEEYQDFIKFASQMKNTLLIFLSDHGYRYGPLKNTISGWYEEKLPFLWFVLSQDLKEKYPNWVQNLQINSKKLTSPFDLHKTLVEILKVTSNYTVPDSKTKSGIKVSKQFGQSLISQEVPDSRKCEDAGIPDVYCACARSQNAIIDSYKIQKAAELAVEKINSFLPSKICSKLELARVEAGAILENVAEVEYEQYIVSFTTVPGHGLFEAHLRYFTQNGSFTSRSKILRTNSITKSHVSCLKDAHLELYCYCL